MLQRAFDPRSQYERRVKYDLLVNHMSMFIKAPVRAEAPGRLPTVLLYLAHTEEAAKHYFELYQQV